MISKLSPSSSGEPLQTNSYLSGSNASYLETLYQEFLNNPQAVNAEWQHYFATFKTQERKPTAATQTNIVHTASVSAPTPVPTSAIEKQLAIYCLIQAYRQFGHLYANINPLSPPAEPMDARLTLEYYGLTQQDLSLSVHSFGLFDQPTSLQNILERLRSIYCRSIGAEYTFTETAEQEWIRQRLEVDYPNLHVNPDFQRDLLRQLISAETLEKYLDNKYVAQIRFSLEGADAFIPLLNELIKKSVQYSIKEMVIGMAHRGRVNVLLNIMGQSSKSLFEAFEGTQETGLTSGDVKYHRGYSRDVQTEDGSIHLSLAFNPSHLEFISPIVMGSVRARQERNGANQNSALAVIVHGDASVAGEGVVMETINMSQLRAYHLGGSIHIILNNQIGFTTSYHLDARSSRYCSDIAKMINAPVFHVNADDVEAVITMTQLALDYRMTFQKDVFIDLVCYRRHGHQEADDPVPTQPLMYQKIQKHPTAQALYANTLLQKGVCTQKEIDEWTNNYRGLLDAGKSVVSTVEHGLCAHYSAAWAAYIGQHWRTPAETTINAQLIEVLGEQLANVPTGFTLHRKISAILEARQKMSTGDVPIDWGFAEMLAYASLLRQGYTVRLVGEDSRRGTFFHRHATVFDQKTGEAYSFLQHVQERAAEGTVYDSFLSECAAVGYEYGYSTSDPESLVIWEAQFGDFVNVAQVIIDQFISSAWQKWNRLSGLVLFLPHGYEGRGPEHSSSRLERFLQLCAQNNMQIFVPSTPAQLFHVLRRQVLRPYRKPLIVLTPKSLLRHKLAVSTTKDFTDHHLQLVIPEIDEQDPKAVSRIILCSGKVYYDLLLKRREKTLQTIAIVRIEQLYPFPYDELVDVLQHYPHTTQIVWCQEEPKNQGAWFSIRQRLLNCMRPDQTLSYAGRPASAAPAPGYSALHQHAQTQLVNDALGLEEEP